jgi:hypothetical protein
MGFFKKLGQDATRIFNKVSRDAPGIGRKISTGATNALNGIANASKVLSNNAIVKDLGGDVVTGTLGRISNIANDAANTVNYKNYHGGFNQVSNQLQKNIRGIKNDAENVFAK